MKKTASSPKLWPDRNGPRPVGRRLYAQANNGILIYPEDEIGKKFWKRIYEEAAKKIRNNQYSSNTFNKVWIVPEKAVVYENAKAGTAYVVESKLKVMLEQDYLSLRKHTDARGDIMRARYPQRAQALRDAGYASRTELRHQ